MITALILLISTDEEVISTVRRQVTEMGHHLIVARTFEEAEAIQDRCVPNVLLLQTDAPGLHIGSRLLDALRTGNSFPVIALARNRSIRDAVSSIRAGAADYLPAMPANNRLLGATLDQAMKGAEARRAELPESYPFACLVTTDPRMLMICQLLANAADTDAPLLIEGESGTGKTLMARMAHESSSRRAGPLVEVHCGTLNEALLEKEIFGQARADSASEPEKRGGRLAEAAGGTLLLDEIDHASPSVQARLCRATEGGPYEQEDDRQTLQALPRLVCTAAPHLDQRVAEGMFSNDLYDRFFALRVTLPPLRERVADIPLLARHLLRGLAAQHRREVTEFAPSVLDVFVRYSWPGNVRELRNIIERGVILSSGSQITIDTLPTALQAHARVERCSQRHAPADSLRAALREPERRCILMALRQTGWNKQHTAQQLGISRSTLYKKMKEYDLETREEPAMPPLSGMPEGLLVSGGG